MRPFNSALKAVDRCWDDSVFLAEIFPKFYKLTLQIILRLSRWITDVIHYVNANKNPSDLPNKLGKTNFLVVLYVDIRKFCDNLPSLQEKIINFIPNDRRANETNILEALDKSFTDLQQIFCEHQRTIQSSLVNILITESGLDNIRQVNDLPRLYRKTNREVPSRSSTYVEQMLRPMKIFAEQSTAQLGTNVVETVLIKVFSRVTTECVFV